MIDVVKTLGDMMELFPASREAWHRATQQQRLAAARCVVANFSDVEWTPRKAKSICRTVVSDVTILLGGRAE